MRRRWLSVLRYFGLAPTWEPLYPGRVIDFSWSPRSGITLHEWSGMPTAVPSVDALNVTFSNIFGTWRRVDLWSDWAWT